MDLDDNWRSFVDAGTGEVDALLGYLMARPHPDARIQLALATGVCGGFSTMSTFSWEALQWAKTGSTLMALGYITATLVLSIGAAAAAYALANK